MQNTAIKLLFFVAVWKRPVITEICFMGISRLRKVPGFNIQVLAVISEESMIPLCEKYGVDWCFTKNDPLGAKKNYGISQALRKDFDYLVEIGSDDLFKDEFLNLYNWDRDIMALSDFIMMDTRTGECRRMTKHHAYFGTGRAISKKALQAVGTIWPDNINKGLDNNSTMIMARKGFLEKRIATSEPVAIGLKSDVNIWPFEKLGSEYSLEQALNGLSNEEINAIQCLTLKNKLADSIGV